MKDFLKLTKGKVIALLILLLSPSVIILIISKLFPMGNVASYVSIIWGAVSAWIYMPLSLLFSLVPVHFTFYIYYVFEIIYLYFLISLFSWLLFGKYRRETSVNKDIVLPNQDVVDDTRKHHKAVFWALAIINCIGVSFYALTAATDKTGMAVVVYTIPLILFVPLFLIIQANNSFKNKPFGKYYLVFYFIISFFLANLGVPFLVYKIVKMFT